MTVGRGREAKQTHVPVRGTDGGHRRLGIHARHRQIHQHGAERLACHALKPRLHGGAEKHLARAAKGTPQRLDELQVISDDKDSGRGCGPAHEMKVNGAV
jgi:hypothetical protein